MGLGGMNTYELGRADLGYLSSLKSGGANSLTASGSEALAIAKEGQPAGGGDGRPRRQLQQVPDRIDDQLLERGQGGVVQTRSATSATPTMPRSSPSSTVRTS